MASTHLVDALIVGGGPAGLSAALAFARQNQTAIVFDSGTYRNGVVDYMHLIPGLDHVEPGKFRQTAREQITERYGTICFEQGVELVSVQQLPESGFQVADAAGKSWQGKKVILATGVEDVLPDIPGYADCWGKSIFHCLYCKGLENRGESVGVLAFGPLAAAATALHVARQASALSSGGKVTIYTNGAEALVKDVEVNLGMAAAQMKTDNRKVKSVAPGAGGVGVVIHFEDGSQATEAFLAHQPATKPRCSSLVDQLGLDKSPNGEPKVSQPFQQTSVRGVFAAGDSSSMLKNVPNAIFTGHVAGQMASTQLLADQTGQKPLFPL